jgi:hypothetical protein
MRETIHALIDPAIEKLEPAGVPLPQERKWERTTAHFFVWKEPANGAGPKKQGVCGRRKPRDK